MELCSVLKKKVLNEQKNNLREQYRENVFFLWADNSVIPYNLLGDICFTPTLVVVSFALCISACSFCWPHLHPFPLPPAPGPRRLV